MRNNHEIKERTRSYGVLPHLNSLRYAVYVRGKKLKSRGPPENGGVFQILRIFPLFPPFSTFFFLILTFFRIFKKKEIFRIFFPTETRASEIPGLRPESRRGTSPSSAASRRRGQFTFVAQRRGWPPDTTLRSMKAKRAQPLRFFENLPANVALPLAPSLPTPCLHLNRIPRQGNDVLRIHHFALDSFDPAPGTPFSSNQ